MSEDVRTVLVRLLREAAESRGMSDAVIDDQTDVLHSGIIDSLAFVGLLLAVENELGITLALDRLDFDNIANLADLVEHLDQLSGAD